MKLKFSKEMYPKFALVKAAYSFTDRSYVHLDANDQYYLVQMESKKPEDVISEGEFENEMLNQCARYEILRRTRTIRELLVARAMASTMIEKHDDSIQYDDQEFDVASILTDWFESDYAKNTL